MSEAIQAPYELGGMTREEFLGDTVVKTMVLPVSAITASRLAYNLETYYGYLQDEPLPVPRVTHIGIVKTDAGHHVHHSMDLVPGPNLCSLQGEARAVATKDILTKLALMSTFDGQKLITPIDAKATNIHVDPEAGATLVDLFPPLARHSDGSFPIENIPQGASSLRSKIVPYMNGTREGAMLRVLSTVISGGSHPLRQLRQMAEPAQDWCYDVLPTDLDNHTKERLRQAIRTKFIRQWIQATTSGAMHQLRNRVGLKPYF